MATASSKSFPCRVVTPAEQLLDETVSYASMSRARAWIGGGGPGPVPGVGADDRLGA